MAKHLQRVTLTGVDECTDRKKLTALSEKYPFAEWGVLYSAARAGTTPRYPALAWIDAFAKHAAVGHLPIALHLCGNIVTDLLTQVASGDDNSPVLELCRSFGRVQLNVNAARHKAIPLQAYEGLIRRLTRPDCATRCVVQLHDGNTALVEHLSALDLPVLDFLVDASGGNGQEAATWPDLNWGALRHAAFAGGLGPDNIAEKLAGIAALALVAPFGVDMESRVRDTADQFDLQKCEAVLEAAQAFIDAHGGWSPCRVLEDAGLTGI